MAESASASAVPSSLSHELLSAHPAVADDVSLTFTDAFQDPWKKVAPNRAVDPRPRFGAESIGAHAARVRHRSNHRRDMQNSKQRARLAHGLIDHQIGEELAVFYRRPSQRQRQSAGCHIGRILCFTALLGMAAPDQSAPGEGGRHDDSGRP